MANDAVTPPVVGSVSTEMKGRPASSSRARAAEILAICIRDSAPSCMRAPPEHEKMISGTRSRSARSAQRVTFSPTTLPMDPPMKPYSIIPQTTGRPPSSPAHEMKASCMPVFFW